MQFDEAKALHLAGEFEAAIAGYREVVEQNPDDATCWNMLGNALFDISELPPAMEAYRKAIALRADWAAPHFNLANALFALDRLDDAVAEYQAALARDPQWAAAHFNLGNVYFDRGQWEAAVEAYQAARGASADPDADIAFNLGRALFELGRFEEALPAMQEAVAAAPDMVRAHSTLGMIWFELSNPMAAIAAHRRATELDPQHAGEHLSLARALMTIGQWAEAEQSLLRVLTLSPTASTAYEMLGRIYLESHQQAKLAELLDRWQKTAPQDPRLAHLRAAWTGEPAAPRASDEYVRTMFDNFASTFDNTLRKLNYRAPQLVADELEQRTEGRRLQRVLDAGCGTGLCGPALRARCERLVGVDLSPAMLDVAATREVYDQLETAELTQYLRREANAFSAIASADTLVYFGALEEVIAAAHDALEPGGWFVFTVEQLAPKSDVDYQLSVSGRYTHREAYVQRVLEEAGFTSLTITHVILREEGGQPVVGLLAAGRK